MRFKLKHPLHAGVHLVFLDVFAAGDLIYASLDLLLELLVMGE